MRLAATVALVGVLVVPGVARAQVIEGVPFGGGALPGVANGDFLTQPPTVPACPVSDPILPQVMAENFVVSGDPIEIAELVVWGIYYFGNTPGVDEFAVRFLRDGGGLPGAEVAPRQIDVPTARIDAGFDLEEWDIYEFTLSLVSPVQLDPGTYWVEVYEDYDVHGNWFCWVQSESDPVRGIPEAAITLTWPPTWVPYPVDLSLELNGLVIPVELESFEIER